MRKFALTLLFSAALALSGAAQIVYVDSNAAAGGDGTSWAKAYNDLNPALASATSGTTIWCAIGGYTGDFVVPAGVTMLGGFLGDARSITGNGDVSLLQRTFQNRTNLLGAGGRTLTLGQGAVVDGFWVIFGAGGAPGGGGALIDGVDAEIRNCFFRTNNDTAGKGAALLVRNGANPRVENCVFAINGDAQSGAAIEVDAASGTFVNLTVDLNEHSGMRLTGDATPRIYNSIFTGNGSPSSSDGYGIDQVSTGADPELHNNLFFGNKAGAFRRGASVHGTAAQINALAYASGNLDVDPQYFGINDWRLAAGSPAIDAGHPSVFPQRTQGLYDQSRRLDGDLDGVVAVDIGAAEFTNVSVLLPVDTHKHVHVGVSGTAGMPAFLLISAGELPGGFFVNPAGFLFLNPVNSILVPYFTIPTPPGQAINYPPGVPSGVPTYWQAVTFGGAGVNLSNPGVHVTN